MILIGLGFEADPRVWHPQRRRLSLTAFPQGGLTILVLIHFYCSPPVSPLLDDDLEHSSRERTRPFLEVSIRNPNAVITQLDFVSALFYEFE